MSQMEEQVYFDSLNGFNIPEGTLPYGQFEDRSSRLHRKILNKIGRVTRLKPHETKLLDIGCSSGAFVAAAKEIGYVAMGVEPAVEPAKTAQKKGLNVIQGSLQELQLPENYYDVITLFEVIEHLKDPMELLQECKRILKAGGVMAISTGNTDSWTVDFMKQDWDYFMNHGGHISFFNPVSISLMARRAGFKVIKLQTRSVSLYRRDQVSKLRFSISKILREVLALPAKLFDKGHDLLVFLRK
jgi:2-polyprenyl-3-methyl-5-hydroxy-6-metoxy-1,4-benzoquinol methylase